MVSIMEYVPTTPSQQQAVQSQQQQQQQQTAGQPQPQTISCTTTTTDTKPRSTAKSAVSQRSIELQIDSSDLAKRDLKLDLVNNSDKDIDEFCIKSPKSPLATSVRCGHLPHQKSLTSQVDLVEDRKTLRDALYQGIFHRHRRTIFAVGSFLRMLRSRNSQYNTIRSSSEGEDIDETR